MLYVDEFKKQPDCLSDYLPWVFLATEGVVFNKDGSFQKTFKFQGKDINSTPESELVSINEQLNNCLKRLESGWGFFFETQRVLIKDYFVSIFPDKVTKLIDTERETVFQEEKKYESINFITFIYKPPVEQVAGIRNKLYENITDDSTNYDFYLNYFKTHVDSLEDILSNVFINVKALKNDDVLTYLHSTISTKKHRVKMPEIPMFLDALLSDEPLILGIEPKLGDSFIKTISIRFLPDETFPGMLSMLNDLNFEYRWSSRFICLDSMEADREINKIKKFWFSKRKGIYKIIKEAISKNADDRDDITVDDDVNPAIILKNDAQVAQLEASEQKMIFGRYTATITVFDKDPKIVLEKIKQVEKIINSMGFTCIREDINAVEAWLSSIPGQMTANVRMPIIHSRNLSRIVNLFGTWSGQKENKHLKDTSLLVGTTSGSTPFYFSNHVEDVGHTMILGPTGSGKSVFLNFMKAQFLRYKNAQVISFDKLESSLALTRAVDGAHCDIGVDPIKFQPLRHIDDQLEFTWATNWLCELFENEKVKIRSENKNNIVSALKNLAELPDDQRTITSFSQLLQDTTLRESLFSYTLEGPYGYLFDASEDNLSVSKWQNFEVDTLLKQKNIIPIVFSYIFHKIEKKFNGNPTLLVLDEAWEYLGNEIFAKKIKEWLLTARKNNVSVVFATAGISQIHNNLITDVLLESCPTTIYLPNPRATEKKIKQIYDDFGLNEVEINLIQNALPKREYYYSSPLGKRLFDLQLFDVSLAFCGSSSKKDRALIKDIYSKYPESFAFEFLKAKGLNDYAELIK